MPYPTYSVNGILMDDGRGRWVLTRDTAVLPSFPGFVNTQYTIPGRDGARQPQAVALNDSSFKLQLRFDAIDDNGVIASDIPTRYANMSRNINLFYTASGIARSGVGGLIRVEKQLESGVTMYCAARLLSATDPQYDGQSDYATVDFIFNNPSGVWRSTGDADLTSPTGGKIKAQTTTNLYVPTGSANCNTSLIAIQGPVTQGPKGGRISVLNEFRFGFEMLSYGFTGNNWLIVDTGNWRYGYTNNSTLDWNTGLTLSQYISPRGRPQGGALSITPCADQAHLGTGIVRFYVPGPAASQYSVRVLSKKTYY